MRVAIDSILQKLEINKTNEPTPFTVNPSGYFSKALTLTTELIEKDNRNKLEIPIIIAPLPEEKTVRPRNLLSGLS